MILDLIKKRRAVFPMQYNGKTIDKPTLLKVLEAANYAPTHKRTEPWRFKVITGQKLDQTAQKRMLLLADFVRDVWQPLCRAQMERSDRETIGDDPIPIHRLSVDGSR